MNHDAIAQLEQLLVEEREAIKALDGASVLAFAKRKEALMASIRGRDEALDADAAARLHALVPALRQNGILLAHGRDILRDALVAVGAASRVAGAPTSRRMLSVRG
jgi:hypothetical protein